MNKNLLLILLVCLTIAGTVFIFNKNNQEGFLHLIGEYEYQEQGYDGTLTIKNNNSQLEISLLNVHIDSLQICSYKGICTLNKGIITCDNDSKPINIIIRYCHSK